MNLSNGPAENVEQSPGAGDEPSPNAPKWLRQGHRAVRKVVPLHLPAAPQLVPMQASGAAPTAAAARGRRPTGPELLAEDAVLKRLLQRHSPDPQPAPVAPVRDPLGLALGMVARLIVASCVVAGAALLAVGVIPLPFKAASPGVYETASASSQPTIGAAPTERAASAPATVNETGAATQRAAGAPAQVAAVVVRQAPAAAAADQWTLDAGEIERLVKRGEEYLAGGDIAAARLVLGRAAEARDAHAAFSLATTYDPAVLKQLRVFGFKADLAQARAWYERAAAYGSAEAARRLATLANAPP